MTCEQIRDQFTDALYNELDAKTRHAFEEHLAACAVCRVEYFRLREALSIMDKHERTELSQSEWEDYWNTLRAKLKSNDQAPAKTNVIRWYPVPAWAYGIAAVLVLAIGIYLGRTYFGSRPEIVYSDVTQNVTSPVPTSDSTTQQAVAYLERTRNLLIGLSNLNEEHRSSIDLRLHQQISRTLVDQGNVLTVSLNKPDQQLLRQLIRDLQIILLQLANMEARPGLPVVEFVKKGIDEKSILLKINLEEMRAKSRQPSIENTVKKNNKNL